jgi:hypothetical protein
VYSGVLLSSWSQSADYWLLFSVVDFSVVVLPPASGALLSVLVVVVDSEDFSDTAGEAGAPSEPC